MSAVRFRLHGLKEDMSMNGMKRMDKEKFIEAYNGFVFGGLSLEQAAKVAGRSVPTIRKYFLWF